MYFLFPFFKNLCTFGCKTLSTKFCNCKTKKKLFPNKNTYFYKINLILTSKSFEKFLQINHFFQIFYFHKKMSILSIILSTSGNISLK